MPCMSSQVESTTESMTQRATRLSLTLVKPGKSTLVILCHPTVSTYVAKLNYGENPASI